MLSRRQFCAGVGVGVGAATLAAGCPGDPEAPEPQQLPSAGPPTGLSVATYGSGASAVVEVRWAAAMDAWGNVHQGSVDQMLKAAMEALIGPTNPWASWASGSRRLSIKVNSITSQAFSHPEVGGGVARAVVAAGASADRVTVWDHDSQSLQDRGYQLDHSGKGGFRCLGSTSAGGGTLKSAVIAGRHKVTFSPLLTGADALINVAALKDHSMAGVTLSLKNNFGMIWGAENLHGNVARGDACEPGISQLAANAEIKGRLELCMIDALAAVCEGGPGRAEQRHAFRYGGLLVSRDPVALDRRGLAIIEARRATLGLPTLSKRSAPNPSPPIHIDNAAKLGVGKS